MAGWLHSTYRNKCPAWGIELGIGRPSHNRARQRLTSLIEANALNTTPNHQPVV